MKTSPMISVAIFVLTAYAGCKSESSLTADAAQEVSTPGADVRHADVQPSGTGGALGEVGANDSGVVDAPLATGGSGGGIDAGDTEAGPNTSVDAARGFCLTDNDCTLEAWTGCCGGCYAAGDPLAPTMPCSSACPGGMRASTCACVNNRCTVGYLPAGSACDPARDLCLGGTKCCSACTGSGADGGLVCATPVCTTPTPMISPAQCPTQVPPPNGERG
jgi:hypothetical protein